MAQRPASTHPIGIGTVSAYFIIGIIAGFLVHVVTENLLLSQPVL